MKFWSAGLLGVGVGLGLGLAATNVGWAGDWVVVPKEGAEFTAQRAAGFSGGDDFFPEASGVYNGLIAPSDEIIPERSGYFRISISSGGNFSGRLGVGDNTVPIKGWFNAQGRAGVSIYKRVWDDCHCFHELILTWTVELRLIENSDEIDGTVVNERQGGWLSDLYGLRAGYTTSHDPAPQAGRYTVRLPGGLDATVAPPGDGYGAVTVNSCGLVKLNGALPDGVKIADSAYISIDGYWPFYVPLNQGDGLLFGWLRFDSGAVTGDITWIKASRSDATFYPDGFDGTISVTGGEYSVASGAPSPFNWTDGQLQVSEGNLGPGVLANAVQFTSAGKLIDAGGDLEGLKTKINTKTGTFSGSFLHPVSGKKTGFAGALFQFEDAGGGYFLGIDQGGIVRLTEAAGLR
jgi:hypothetical protein